MNHLISAVRSTPAHFSNSYSLILSLSSLISLTGQLCQTLGVTPIPVIICLSMASTKCAAVLHMTPRLAAASSLSRLLWPYCTWRRMRILDMRDVVSALRTVDIAASIARKLDLVVLSLSLICEIRLDVTWKLASMVDGF